MLTGTTHHQECPNCGNNTIQDGECKYAYCGEESEEIDDWEGERKYTRAQYENGEILSEDEMMLYGLI